jgi:hypothetical protein
MQPCRLPAARGTPHTAPYRSVMCPMCRASCRLRARRWWVDAHFMAMGTFARIGNISGDRRCASLGSEYPGSTPAVPCVCVRARLLYGACGTCCIAAARLGAVASLPAACNAHQVCMGDRSLCACWLPPAHALVLGGSPHFRAPSSLRELRGHSCEHLGLLARSHAAWDTAPRGILSLAERIGPGFMTRRMRCGTTLPSDAACGAHQVRSMQHDTLRATCNTRHATCNTTRGVHGALHARFHVVLLRAQRTPSQLCVWGPLL